MEKGLIDGFTTYYQQNAFLALVGFGFVVGCLLIRFLLLELRSARKETNSLLEKFNLAIIDYTKATTELTTEIKYHVKSK